MLKTVNALAAALAGLLFALPRPSAAPSPGTTEALPQTPAAHAGTAAPSPQELTGVVQQYCVVCHNDRRLRGNLSLEDFDAAKPIDQWATAEKMIHKLRGDQMPPPGARRPGGDTLQALASSLESTIDTWAAAHPTPGARVFQRLNQPEYERAIQDLLGIRIDAGEFLPPDQKSANFDDIADAQLISPTLVTAYMNAASAVSRLAVGDPRAAPREVTFDVSPLASQSERVEGAPMGSRGGISQIYNVPADGRYRFTLAFAHSLTGKLYGWAVPDEQLEISVDGERLALLDLDAWMDEGQPNGVTMETEPLFIRAGPRRISVVFVKKAEGPADDLTSPNDWSIPDRNIGDAGYGVENLPHLRSVSIRGPFDPSGVSDDAPRDRIFTCHPSEPAEQRTCARTILSSLADRAFRGLATDGDVDGLMRLYDDGAARLGFEEGVRLGLQAILANPKFTFRLETPGERVKGTDAYRVSDVALASRLSFFLWSLPPDEELLAVARKGKLHEDGELEKQVRRMLADPRAEALATRFADQWLRLNDLDKVHPDAFWFPDFDEQLRDAMKRETELFFLHVVQEDRSFFDLIDADYTFVNERLAKHYGIPGVVGDEFRRVKLTDPRRRGILGQASVLTSTSFGNRTSIVIRGKWVLEVLLNSPPPPPPPNVPALEATAGVTRDRVLTSKERQEMHRAAPACAACHDIIDPIGIPLEVFDVTGRIRKTERRDMGNEAIPIDTRSQFWNGTPVSSPEDLRKVLLSFPTVLTRAFTTNLMTYALGRRVEYYDQPAIRKITADAAKNDYRMSSYILGVVKSDAFRMMVPQSAATEAEKSKERDR